jgi:hypothetical protein
MTFLLAETYQQGRHYARQMFPDKNPDGPDIRIVVADPTKVRGARGLTAFKVGTFPRSKESWELLDVCIASGLNIVQGPRF